MSTISVKTAYELNYFDSLIAQFKTSISNFSSNLSSAFNTSNISVSSTKITATLSNGTKISMGGSFSASNFTVKSMDMIDTSGNKFHFSLNWNMSASDSGLSTAYFTGYSYQFTNNAGKQILISESFDKLMFNGSTSTLTHYKYTITDGSGGSVTLGSDSLSLQTYISFSGQSSLSDMIDILGGDASIFSGNDSLDMSYYTTDQTLRTYDGNDKLIGGSGNDSINGGEGADTMSGGDGDDTYNIDNLKDIVIEKTDQGNDTVNISLASGFVGKFSNIENIVGDVGNDTITLSTALISGIIDLAGGADKLILAAGTNSLTLSNIETVIGNKGADTIVMETALSSGATIDLGAGTDSLTLSDDDNTAVVKNVETITGGTSDDTITLAAAQASGTVDLGDGSDTLVITGATSLSISNVETINGTNAADTLTLKNAINDVTIDLGKASDKLVLAAGDNHVVISNVETLLGNTGNDDVTIDPTLRQFIFAKSSSDKATLTFNDDGSFAFTNRTNGDADGFGTWTMDDSGVINIEWVDQDNGETISETCVFNENAKTITWTNGVILQNLTPKTGLMNADLGEGNDTLTLSDTFNVLTLKNVENIHGGSWNDIITLGSAQNSGSIDLGSGTDKLILAAGANTLSVSNVEKVIGNKGVDTITIVGSTGSFVDGKEGNDILSGGDGDDIFNGGTGNDILTGGEDNDIFVFNTALNATTNLDTITDFTSGSDIIQLENAIFKKLTATGTLSADNFISVTGAEKALDANDYIVYHTDTGVLSYDADGSGKGAEIAIAVLGVSEHPQISASDFMVS